MSKRSRRNNGETNTPRNAEDEHEEDTIAVGRSSSSSSSSSLPLSQSQSQTQRVGPGHHVVSASTIAKFARFRPLSQASSTPTGYSFPRSVTSPRVDISAISGAAAASASNSQESNDDGEQDEDGGTTGRASRPVWPGKRET
jgi:hypothetical protein